MKQIKKFSIFTNKWTTLFLVIVLALIGPYIYYRHQLTSSNWYIPAVVVIIATVVLRLFTFMQFVFVIGTVVCFICWDMMPDENPGQKIVIISIFFIEGFELLRIMIRTQAKKEKNDGPSDPEVPTLIAT